MTSRSLLPALLLVMSVAPQGWGQARFDAGRDGVGPHRSVVTSAPLLGRRSVPRARPTGARMIAAAPAPAPGRGALPLEMLAGSAGAALGIGVVGLSADCGGDDLGCVISAVGAAGALGALGAATAVVLTARAMHAPRSVAGAALGAVVGTGAGLGVHWLLNHGSDRNLDRPAVVIPIFAISQGVFATLGSHLAGR